MRIGIVAGEASGDLLGAGLINAVRKRNPAVEFEGVAGPMMQAAGCKVIENADALAVMGLIEPIREVPRLLRLRRMLVSRWQADPPDVVIGIDAPDFNLGLELKLRRSGIRTVQYVSPTVWAWRQGRIKKIRKAVDLVLCLLPFEKQFYDEHDVAAVFVGHPVAERLTANPDTQAARRRLGLGSELIVAVLPGSRQGEVQRLGQAFASACALIVADKETENVSFVAPMASPELRSVFQEQLQAAGMLERFLLLDGDSETAMTAADVALLASGTASLEAAMLGTPAVVAYKVARLTRFVLKVFRLLKAPYIAMPNLLAGKLLLPEFVQEEATPEALKAAVSELLLDPVLRDSIAKEFSRLRRLLAHSADERAASAILELIGQR